jgi:hypothetical protein
VSADDLPFLPDDDPRDPESGLKLDPEGLTDVQKAALVRATCAAAEFCLVQGEDSLVGAEDGIASLPLVAFSGRPLPRVAAKAVEELAGSGLVVRSGCASEAAGLSA